MWFPDKVEILLDTPAPLNIPVLIPEKFGMDLAVSLSAPLNIPVLIPEKFGMDLAVSLSVYR